MPAQRSVPDLVRSLGPIFGAGIEIAVKASSARVSAGRGAGPLRASVHAASRQHKFVVEFRARNTPLVVDEARMRAQDSAKRAGLLPMVIVPHLSAERIDSLLSLGVSGIDLCGNGAVSVPGELLLRRDGQPNRFRDSRPCRFAYRGTTSLVPRAFLHRAEFASVGMIRDEIARHGGTVAMSTVSKALARMEEDLLVVRETGAIRLAQRDALIDALAQSFRLPRELSVARLRWRAPIDVLCRALAGERVALSGLSSASAYSAGMRADRPVLYCADLGRVKRALGREWSPEERFGDVSIVETDDPTPLFGTVRGQDGATRASALQTYLELFASGDPRDRQMASEVRELIGRDARR